MTKGYTDEPKGFDKAKKKAQELLKDQSKLKNLLDQAVEKSKKQQNALKGFAEDFKNFQRLLKAYVSGDYRKISLGPILAVLGAIVYFVNPFDVIPDFIVGFGFLDDVTIVAYVIKTFKKEIDQFLVWEEDPEADLEKEIGD